MKVREIEQNKNHSTRLRLAYDPHLITFYFLLLFFWIYLNLYGANQYHYYGGIDSLFRKLEALYVMAYFFKRKHLI